MQRPDELPLKPLLPMRFGILTQYYPPETGAPQARLSALARRFVCRGHEVFVLTCMPNYPLGHRYPGYSGMFRRESRDGAGVIRTYIYPKQSARLAPRMASYISFVLSSLAVGAAALPKMDYLLTESPPLFLGISGFVLSRLKKARWIFNVSDLWPESAVRLGVVSEGWSLRAAYAVEAFCYKRAWLVSAQSREILDSVGRRFGDVPLYHLSNGVDPNLFHPSRRSQLLRRGLADGKKCVAVYAGLHGVAQGLQQILEAAARLQDVEELMVTLVGDGPEKKQLVQRSKTLGLKNVRFLDHCDHDKIPGLLASADIALVPLKDRLPGAVPSKLYEAMAAGLPVVLAADGEAADIVWRANCGLVVPAGDVSALALALRDLARNAERRVQMGAAGRQAAVGSFDRRAVSDAFIRHLEEQD